MRVAYSEVGKGWIVTRRMAAPTSLPIFDGGRAEPWRSPSGGGCWVIWGRESGGRSRTDPNARMGGTNHVSTTGAPTKTMAKDAIKACDKRSDRATGLDRVTLVATSPPPSAGIASMKTIPNFQPICSGRRGGGGKKNKRITRL